jgi:hypothetical protein
MKRKIGKYGVIVTGQIQKERIATPLVYQK